MTPTRPLPATLLLLLEPKNQWALAPLLESDGHRILEASTPEETLQHLKQYPVDLLLMDSVWTTGFSDEVLPPVLLLDREQTHDESLKGVRGRIPLFPLQNVPASVRQTLRELELEARLLAAEMAQARSEAMYRLMVDGANEGIWAVDSQCRTTFMNRKMAEMLQVDSQRALGRLMADFLFPEDLGEHRQRMGKRSADRYEQRLRRRDGSVLWALVSMTPLWGDQHQYQGAFGHFTDITENKASLERERELHNLLRNLADNAPDMLWAKDLEGRYLFANRAICEGLLQATGPEEVLGKTDLFFAERERKAHPDNPQWHTFGELCQDSDAVTLEGRAPGRFDEYGNIRGRLLYLDVHKKPLFGNQGQLIGTVGVGRDVTQIREMQKALKESEERYRNLVNRIGEGVGIVDAEERFLFANPAAESIMGASPGSLIGMNLLDLVPPASRQRLAEQTKQRKTGIQSSYELEFLRPDGESKILFITATPRFSEDGAYLGAFAVFRDISDIKRLESERLALERRLLHSQKLESLGVLAGGIAHDFNNLLMAILGNLEIAAIDLSPLSPARIYIEQARQASRRATDLTRQMLAYSGRGAFQNRKLDLNLLVQENAHLFRAAVPKTTLFQMKLDPNPMMIQGDPGQIQQIIMNLITNSAEAIQDSGTVQLITSRAFYRSELLQASSLPEKPEPGLFVGLEVQDDGCGMDEATQAKLFDPFFSTKFTGRGLGMAALLGIVRGHRGAILVESVPKQGTRIQVLFPALEENTKFEGCGEGKVPKSSELPTTGILVVDDEPAVLQTAQMLLERLGHSVYPAHSGEQALEVYQEQKAAIGAALLDLSMPGMDGLISLKNLRELNADLPILLCSGYAEQELDGRLGGISRVAFIQKPFELEKLKEALESLIRQ